MKARAWPTAHPGRLHGGADDADPAQSVVRNARSIAGLRAGGLYPEAGGRDRPVRLTRAPATLELIDLDQRRQSSHGAEENAGDGIRQPVGTGCP